MDVVATLLAVLKCDFKNSFVAPLCVFRRRKSFAPFPFGIFNKNISSSSSSISNIVFISLSIAAIFFNSTFFSFFELDVGVDVVVVVADVGVVKRQSESSKRALS